MEKFDIGLAYVWEYDKEFIDLLEQRLQNAGLTTYIIGDHNLYEAAEKIAGKEMSFRFYLDRAWDVEENYEEFGKMLMKRKTIILNGYKYVTHAIDKATMHLEFITNGINVPYSIIIPPKSQHADVYISVSDLAHLGRPFIIKPCNTTGGGTGVVTGAESLDEILDERHTFGDDKYILQEKIYPTYLGDKRAWFRCFWAFGKPIPTWWDDTNHRYSILTEDEFDRFALKKLFSITKKIASLTALDFFSTEIALCTSGKFISIDYINDQCDMRLQSSHFDGVPNEIAEAIIDNLIKYIKRIKKTKKL